MKYWLAYSFLLIIILGGCAPNLGRGSYVRRTEPEAPGQIRTTGPESEDVNAIAQRLVRELVGIPEISQAINPPRIALLPVKNRTRFRIDADVFTVLMQNLLIKHAGDRVRFVRREILKDIIKERERKREGIYDSSGQKPIAGTDFFLEGELRSLSVGTSAGVSDWILYSFKLSDAESGIIVWSGSYQTKKEGLWGTVYH